MFSSLTELMDCFARLLNPPIFLPSGRKSKKSTSLIIYNIFKYRNTIKKRGRILKLITHYAEDVATHYYYSS